MPRAIYLSQALLSDEAFEGLSGDAQRAWFLLRLDPRIGITGMGRISPGQIASTLRTDENQALLIRSELERKWVEYDAEKGLLCFCGAYRLEPNSKTVRIAALREIERFPHSVVALNWLIRYQKRFLTDCNTAEEKQMFSALLLPYGYGIDTMPRASVDRTGPDRTGRERDSEVEATAPTASALGRGPERISPSGGNGHRTGPKSRREVRRPPGLVDGSEAGRGRAEVQRLKLADLAHQAGNLRAGVVVRELVAVGVYVESGNAVYAHPDPDRAWSELAVLEARGFTIQTPAPVPTVAPADELELRIRKLGGIE